MPRSPKNNQVVMLDLSWAFLLKLVTITVAVWAFFALRDIFFMLVVVFIFVAAVNPTISNMQRHMSRTLAVSFFFTVLLLTLMMISYIFIPSFLHQYNELRLRIPEYLATGFGGFADGGIAGDVLGSIQSNLSAVSGNLFKTTLGVFGGLVTAVTGLVISFYLLLEENNAREFFHQVLPKNRFKAVYTTVAKISDRMGSWVRAQLMLMLIIGSMNFIAFLILGVPSPVPLSIWSGLTEAIPYFGPVLGVIPAVLVALGTGNILQAVLVVLINFVLIQQIEAHFIVPKVMGRAIGISPVLVILSILTGLKLFGFVGAIIAIPAAAIISVVVGEWSELRKLWQESEGSNEEA